MLDNSIAITYNSEAVTLNRMNQDGYTGSFFGRDAAGNEYVLEVKHEFPKKPGSTGVEQHLVKLTRRELAEVDGVLTLTSEISVHEVLKTLVGSQVSSDVKNLHNALHGYFVSAEVDKVLARRS
jgi:hypothetical protein